MLDDLQLRERFREREADRAGDVDADALFATILTRIDAAPQRARRFVMPASLLAAACLVLALGSVFFPRMDRQPPTEPEKIEAVKIDKMPPPPSLAATTPKIKMNTLKSNAPEVPAGDLARANAIEIDVASVDDALRAATSIAQRFGGTVTALQDATPREPGVVHGATLTIVVPAGRLDAALAALTALGGVRSRSAAAEAVGGAIVDDAARLRNLRREETDLLRIMGRSGSVGDILDVETKLADVRGQIESLEGELATLKHRIATATIDVTLTERPPAPTPVAAFERGLLAWAPWVLAAIALGLLAWRKIRG